MSEQPDTRFAVARVVELKRQGMAPLLIARGGIEVHEQEVLQRARQYGLRITERTRAQEGARGLIDAL